MCSHFFTYSQCRIPFCYTYGLLYAGRGIAVPRNSLTCYTGRHLRIRRLILFIFAGTVYDNALTDCAALSCRACVDLITCVAERYLTLRTGCERHGKKILCRSLFSKRSHIGNLRRIRKQGKGRSSTRKENRRLSFLFAPTRRAPQRSRRPQTANPPLRFSEKLSAR